MKSLSGHIYKVRRAGSDAPAVQEIESSISVRRGLQVATIWLFVAGVATYSFLMDPAKGTGYPSCPFRMLTGFDCPGCGSSRALHQLLHGHPIKAFEFNPLLVILLPLLALALLSVSRSLIDDKHRNVAIFRPAFAWVVLGIVVSFWIFRNTRFYPFVS